MSLAIETIGLTRRFGERVAVDRLHLAVPERSVYGFLGRNGAGKTTTIKLLLGLLRADAGQALICGIDMARERRAAARKIGALLDNLGLYAHLSGRENLDLDCRLLGLPTRERDRVLDITEMSAHARRPVSDYSLGMRQRLGLARALLGSPEVLLLDEPGNGLDPDGIGDLRLFLKALPERTGATVLVSSHQLGEIEQTCSHVGILDAGRLVLQGRLQELKSGFGRELLIGTPTPTEAGNILRGHGIEVEAHADGLLARLPDGALAEPMAAMINQSLWRAGVEVHALVPRQPSLESLFRTLGTGAANGSEPMNGGADHLGHGAGTGGAKSPRRATVITA